MPVEIREGFRVKPALFFYKEKCHRGGDEAWEIARAEQASVPSVRGPLPDPPGSFSLVESSLLPLCALWCFLQSFSKRFWICNMNIIQKKNSRNRDEEKKSTKCITLPNHYKCHLGCFFSHVYGICLNNIPAPDKCLLGDWIKWLSKCCNQSHTSWWSNFFSHFNPHKPLFFDIGR